MMHMCLKPITIKNKSRYIDYKNGDYLFYTVPCGKCVECEDNRIKSYLLRAYAEVEYTKSIGGLAYVECLTYHDGSLPIWRDGRIQRNNWKEYDENKVYDGIAVFNHKDVRDFFCRLRTRLEREGYYLTEFIDKLNEDGSYSKVEKHIVPIKHFLTEEYGGQYHRPHMHVIFTLGMSCEPEVFEKFVDEEWSHGMIDRYKDNGELKTAKDKVINGNGAIAYVAKYVIKDDDFYSWLRKLVIDKIRTGEYEDKGVHYDTLIDEYVEKELLDRIKPKHFTSNGFGISLASKYTVNQEGTIEHSRDYNFMFENGVIEVKKPNGELDNIVPIPMYIKRKLWYDDIKDFDGSHHWQLNDEGVRYKVNRLTKSIDMLAERYQDIYNNIGNYYSNPSEEYNTFKRNEILNLLDGRSFQDFALYLTCFKGRMFENFDIDSMDIYDLSVRNSQRFTSLDFSFRDSIDLDFVNWSLHDSLMKFPDFKDYTVDLTYRNFIAFLRSKFMVKQSSHYIFNDFDNLYDYFESLTSFRNKEKLLIQEENKKAKAKAKLLSPQYRQHEANNRAHRLALEKIYKRINILSHDQSRSLLERTIP